MIKRLGLFSNTAENQLAASFVDKTHQKIKFNGLRKIYRNINNQKFMTQFLSALKKNFKSTNYTLKLKSLIVLHYFLRKTEFKNQRIVLFAQTELNEIKEKTSNSIMILKSPVGKKKIQLENQQKQYIQKNIIEFYIVYLLKFIAHQTAFLKAKKIIQSSTDSFGILVTENLSKTQDKTSDTQLSSSLKFQVEDETLMSHINNGFQILNLINFIIQSQQIFNKMGRYYIEHEQILNLFIMYLDDLTIYNDYTKKLAKTLTKLIKGVKQEQIKHCFLYLTESQKTSDRLYEFYYNRYYYTKVRKLISMPTFLTIDNDDFERVVKEIKKVDRQLVTIVKQSKYSQEYKMNKTMGNFTEANQSFRPQGTGKMNRTMTESGEKKLSKINMTLENLMSNNRSKKQVEQNITRYIETFEDVYQDEEYPQGKNQADFI